MIRASSVVETLKPTTHGCTSTPDAARNALRASRAATAVRSGRLAPRRCPPIGPQCARAASYGIFVLTLLAVAGASRSTSGASGCWSAGGAATGISKRPSRGRRPGLYAASELGGAAGRSRDESIAWLPAGVPSDRRQGAVFYIHPTTYLERDRWNAPLRRRRRHGSSAPAVRPEPGERVQRCRARSGRHATARRRTAPSCSSSEDAQKALDLAYRDVAAAFDQFVKEAGDRPIILAGHSQGALHLERLLREKVAGKPIARRIVAAYVVGWPISTTADLPALGLPAVRAPPSRAGCILSWMSFGEPANPDLVLDHWQRSAASTAAERRARGHALRQSDQRDAERLGPAGRQIPGRWSRRADLRVGDAAAGQVGAHCDKGLLILDGDIPPLGPYRAAGQQLPRLRLCPVLGRDPARCGAEAGGMAALITT